MAKLAKDKQGKKKINMSSKAAKYFMAHRIDGMSKVDAARKAGMTTAKNTTNIEKTQTYQVLEAKYADKLESLMSLGDVAEEHAKIIKQDKDQGAKLNAIKYYKENVEPEERGPESDEDRLIVIFR